MTAIETPPIPLPTSSWSERLRLLAGAAMTWACLHYVIDAWFLWRGDARPVVLLASQAGVLPGLLAALLLAVTTTLVGWVMPSRHGQGPLVVFALALAVWAATGGTMDDWLILNHPVMTTGDRWPYLKLIPDYVGLFVLTLLIVRLFGYDGRAHGPDAAPGWRSLLALDRPAEEIRKGVLHLIIAVAAGVVVIYLLAGSGLEHTHRGQVYFGVAVGCMAAISVARNVTGPVAAIWSWPVPFLIGLVGLMAAAVNPVLPGRLAGLDVFPPVGGLVRALPIEMVSVGLLAIIYTQRGWDRAH